MVRSNMVLAGEDPVAVDALCSKVMGLNPWDIEMLHQSQKRQMGTMELANTEVVGDDPEELTRRWEKPRSWYGRANREWLVTISPNSNKWLWKRIEARGDTLDLVKTLGVASSYGAAVRVKSHPETPRLGSSLTFRISVVISAGERRSALRIRWARGKDPSGVVTSISVATSTW